MSTTIDLRAATVHELECGDIVELREPYRSTLLETDTDWTHGIVAEIVSRFGMGTPHDGLPQHVSLYLFNPDANEVNFDQPGPGDHGIPTFVDFHVQELILVQKANAGTYDPQHCDVVQSNEEGQ
jgi:hypothetical protein